MPSRPLVAATVLLLLAGPALAQSGPGPGSAPCRSGPLAADGQLLPDPATPPRGAAPPVTEEWPGLITIPYCRTVPVGRQPPRSLDTAITPRRGQVVRDEGAHQVLQAL
jgi:hypothetical protein